MLAALAALPAVRKAVLDDNSCFFHAIAVALNPVSAAHTYPLTSVAAADKPRAAGSSAPPDGAVPTSAAFPTPYPGPAAAPTAAAIAAAAAPAAVLAALDAQPPATAARVAAAGGVLTARLLRSLVAAAVRAAAVAGGTAADLFSGPVAAAAAVAGAASAGDTAAAGDVFSLTDALGEPPEQYARGIEVGNKWGGEIELAVLSRIFSVHIHAVDIECGAVLAYAPPAAATATDEARHIVLLYSGLHYDAVVLAGAPAAAATYAAAGCACAPSTVRDSAGAAPRPIVDVSLFPSGNTTESAAGPNAGAVIADVISKTQALAAALRAAHAYTNTGSFTLKCSDCGAALKGTREATMHCGATGHKNFEEFETK
jgi:ubiquitin thioesterase OTU1